MQEPQEQKLVAQIEALLAYSLGALPLLDAPGFARAAGRPEPRSAVYRGVRTTLVYALVICGGIISLSIATLALFLLPQADGRFGLFVPFPQWSGVSLFVALVMPISLVFSLVFATLVFLRSESAIRHASLQVMRATQATIQREVTALLALGDRISDVQSARLALLLERHETVEGSASYSNLFFPVLSLIPLLTTGALVAKSIADIANAISGK